ncbi:MAG: S8 family serine peptidase [Fimbriimonas sp.]
MARFHVPSSSAARFATAVAALAIVGGIVAAPQRRQAAPTRVSVQKEAAPTPARPIRTKQLPRYAPDVVVVTYREGDRAMRSRIETRLGLVPDLKAPSRYFVRYRIASRAKVLNGTTVETAIEALRREAGVKWAEPDYAITPDQATPNDPMFPLLWGLHNTGQNSGTVDADIDAPEAWAKVPDGPAVRVAVLDDGVEIGHPDLAGNIWVNPGEVAGNGIDDDGNGYVDDVRGWDTADNDNNPNPNVATDAHGTHVAGTVAAVTNNGLGVAGVGKRVKVIPIRMFGGQSTWMSSLANGVDYARIAGARVVNVSYNTDAYTNFLMDAIGRARAADILYVGSSGNNGANIDGLRGRMKETADNIMFVAATDRNDRPAGFSNYGMTTDIAAPGVDIASTIPNGGYELQNGTSMATPHVAAAAGVVRAVFPNLTYAQVIARLNGSADFPPALLGWIAGGRLNLSNALDVDTVAPSAPASPTLLARTTSRLRLQTKAVGDDGNAGAASRYEIRASASPITMGNFAAIPVVAMVPGGVAPGQPVTFEVPNLASRQGYYIAVRAFDNVGNPSPIVTAGPYATHTPAWRDDMEGAPQWTGQAGKTWTLTSGAAFSGQRAWDDSPGAAYRSMENSALTSQGTTVNGYAFLHFMARHDLEKDFDYLFVEASTDGGTNWMALTQLTGTDTQWKSYTCVLPGTSVRNMKIRFRLVSDESYELTGVQIDDVSIVDATPILVDDVESAGGWTADAPWVRSNARAYSPTTAWNDSPVGNYAANLNAVLARTGATDVSAVTDPHLSFAIWHRLEPLRDFLHVYVDRDDTGFDMVTAFNGTSGGWRVASVPLGQARTVRPAFRLQTDEVSSEDGVAIDDVTILGEPWQIASDVTMALNLDGYTGSPAGRTVTVELRDEATLTLVESHTLTLEATGPSVTFKTFGSGFYSATVRMDGWLRIRQPVVLAPGNTFGVSLVNGDADRDNRITPTDYTIVNRAFGRSVGQTGYDPRADLTGDGVVNAADLAIVMRNQRRAGS